MMVVSTLQEVAEFFGLTLSGVRYWRAAGMPGKKGRWDLSRIFVWTMTLGPRRAEWYRDAVLENLLQDDTDDAASTD